jgi:hypothetical protein
VTQSQAQARQPGGATKIKNQSSQRARAGATPKAHPDLNGPALPVYTLNIRPDSVQNQSRPDNPPSLPTSALGLGIRLTQVSPDNIQTAEGW